MIPLNIPTLTGKEQQYIAQLLSRPENMADSYFQKRCTETLKKIYPDSYLMLTKSCTHALEFAMGLLNLQRGDEVILPSFTFVSAANAIVRYGATPVFVDIDPMTMNIDPAAVEQAITSNTRAILIMHYGGWSCEMEKLNRIAARYNIDIIEDAAHALGATFNQQPLGSIGRFGCISFDLLKNITCGQGGLLIINHLDDVERAEIIYENGTDRRKFFRAEVPVYTWRDVGSNYKFSELQAAFLLAQLEMMEDITRKRLGDWNTYHRLLKPLQDDGFIELPHWQDPPEHNGHIFFIKTKDASECRQLNQWLYKQEIGATFHYQPLHLSAMGKKHGRFAGEDRFTSKESARLLRLPVYFHISTEEIITVCRGIYRFYQKDFPF